MATVAVVLAIVSAIPCRAEPPAAVNGNFALRDGDTVVFLGDSITAARSYGKIIENYTLLRFPDRKIRFYNAGQGGDTAAGGLVRLDRDVFGRQATVLIVAYGVNDIGWGLKADAEHEQLYLKSIRSIVTACRERHVRVFVCSAAITAGDPDAGEKSFLQTMCDQGMAAARELGEEAIDVQRTMRGIQRKIATHNESRPTNDKKPAEKITLHAADGVHLNELGQLAMAFAILKGLNAPADVSEAHINARHRQIVNTNHCQVSELKTLDDGIAFQ